MLGEFDSDNIDPCYLRERTYGSGVFAIKHGIMLPVVSKMLSVDTID